MGCSAALGLAQGGMRVAVVEGRALGTGASGVNAGTLSLQIKRAALVPYALRLERWRSTPRGSASTFTITAPAGSPAPSPTRKPRRSLSA